MGLPQHQAGRVATSGNVTGTEAVLLHDLNGQWETTPAPSDGGSIGKIVMVSATEGWAAVESATDGGLLHYQNGHWTPFPSA